MIRCALLVLAACGGGGGFPDAPPPDAAPTGTFSLMWSVVDQNGQPLSCERIAAQTMTALVHNLAVQGGFTEIFTCNSGMGASEAIPIGTYEIDFELGGTFGLLARAPKQVPVTITAGGDTQLTPLTFQVDALGGVALSLATGKPGGNCGTAQNNGAGIDAVSITLQHASDGSCAPITLAISQGATQPGGSYAIDCATPLDRGCIEADQVLSASNVASDAYVIHVRGKIGGKSCWTNNDTIQVPPLGKVLMRVLNLAQTGAPGC